MKNYRVVRLEGFELYRVQQFKRLWYAPWRKGWRDVEVGCVDYSNPFQTSDRAEAIKQAREWQEHDDIRAAMRRSAWRVL